MQPSRYRLLLLLLLLPLHAQAYVDPGAGMLIWQGLLALIGAVLVFIRNPRDTLKRWWQRIIRRQR
ncbi:hypothetical protein [Roseateles sp.]|uniref:hypothetical protein n=1 Tax=Roseateles sp. TaxID=1971397 RepID=UPI0031D088E1